jgi:hypothetical protein
MPNIKTRLTTIKLEHTMLTLENQTKKLLHWSLKPSTSSLAVQEAAVKMLII